MLTLLNSSQMREADKFSASKNAISAYMLMEAAAHAFVKSFIDEYPLKSKIISIYCGPGNNGGDGLAIARLLKKQGFSQICVKIAQFGDQPSANFVTNLNRLQEVSITPEQINRSKPLQEKADIIIDALLGSGLNRPLEGDWKDLVNAINTLKKIIVSVDIPTGLVAEGPINNGCSMIKSMLTITFQRPKLNFFFPESSLALNRFIVVDIGLDEAFIQSQASPYYFVEKLDIIKTIKPRLPFGHKGVYGHALIIAGNTETMGAALLCAEGCLYAGAGLVTACIPKEGLSALNARVPEAMALERNNSFSAPNLNQFQAVAAGPGLKTGKAEIALLKDLIQHTPRNLLVDADALNILSMNPTWLANLPPNTILTPHMKEFDRLFGEHASWWERVETARKEAHKYKLCIVLKNRYTFVVSPQGKVFINPTGSPKIATPGSGDVLTGVITAFLAQGYDPIYAAMLGVYIHGACAETYLGYVLTASTLTKLIPKVMWEIIKDQT